MEIEVYAMLRDVVGSKSIHIDGAPSMTVAQMLEEIFVLHPVLHGKMLDEAGNLQSSVHLLINGRDVRYLDGLETVVTPQDRIHIFPPVGGG